MIPAGSQESNVWSRNGQMLDSKFTLQTTEQNTNLIIHARGKDLNSDYLPALEILLTRLSHINVSIEEIAIERKKETRDLNLRKLLTNHGRPISLCNIPIRPLRKEITSQAAKLGRAPRAKGQGNPTKRIAMVISGISDYDPDALIGMLSGKPNESIRLTNPLGSFDQIRSKGPPPRTSGYIVEPTEPSKEPGFTYIAQYGDNNVFKFGWSTDIGIRMSELNQHIPLHKEIPQQPRWKMIFCTRELSKVEAYELEQKIRDALEQYITHGERFSCTAGVLDSVIEKFNLMSID